MAEQMAYADCDLASKMMRKRGFKVQPKVQPTGSAFQKAQ